MGDVRPAGQGEPGFMGPCIPGVLWVCGVPGPGSCKQLPGRGWIRSWDPWDYPGSARSLPTEALGAGCCSTPCQDGDEKWPHGTWVPEMHMEILEVEGGYWRYRQGCRAGAGWDGGCRRDVLEDRGQPEVLQGANRTLWG